MVTTTRPSSAEKRWAREEEWARRAKLFRTEPTDPAPNDQPALDVSPEDAFMELIISPQNLRRAWRQVKSNRGAPGPDGMTVTEFKAWAGENWSRVRSQLVEGTYQPEPVRRKSIPKSGGKGDRLLGIATDGSGRATRRPTLTLAK